MHSHVCTALVISILLASNAFAASPASPARRNCDHGTPLHNAVANRNLVAVKRLLAEGSDPNARASGYYRNAVPLQLAIQAVSVDCQSQQPDEELFAYLLSVGADI